MLSAAKNLAQRRDRGRDTRFCAPRSMTGCGVAVRQEREAYCRASPAHSSFLAGGGENEVAARAGGAARHLVVVAAARFVDFLRADHDDRVVVAGREAVD